jgi:hypothetical protein
MHIAPYFSAAVAVGIAAFSLPGCAGKTDNEPTILEGMKSSPDGIQTRFSDPRPGAFDSGDPILLPLREPHAGGIAYRVTLEGEGQLFSRGTSSKGKPPVRESRTLEGEFRKLPLENPDPNNAAFLVGLDGLYYEEKRQPPPFEREIEIADDRVRITVNGETSVDNRGKRVTGSLAPRIFLSRIFGVISHDSMGNPTGLSARGAPAARKFMNDIPILSTIAYATIPLPEEPIQPGSRWTGIRIPPGRSGQLGLSLTINYSLTGFEVFEGVPCAMILIDSHIDEKQGYAGVTGHRFDRVQATLSGTAWVELDTSIVRRVVLSDEISTSWTNASDPRSTIENRIDFSSKLVLSLRESDKKSVRWANGKRHFESR